MLATIIEKAAKLKAERTSARATAPKAVRTSRKAAAPPAKKTGAGKTGGTKKKAETR
jgi:hypothetical protein